MPESAATESVFQCVPNFSEGRRAEVVSALADAVAQTPGTRLIDCSADADHHRCVLTYLGPPDALRAASLAAARIAIAQIDMRAHAGVHPRTGALDVLPVVPLRGAGREEAIALAHAIGSDLASELALPVCFYAWAARPGRPSALPELRRAWLGGQESLRLRGRGIENREQETGSGGQGSVFPTPDPRPPAPPRSGRIRPPHPPLLTPDLGPATPHPTAGIAIVGARGPLVAYNVCLNTPDVEVARAIARRIRAERERRPELEGVRALGLYLASQNRAQVSMNLTRPDRSPLPAVFAFVQEEAARRGVEAVESEIIGALPLASLGGQSPNAIRWSGYRPTQILETWLP